MSRGFFAAIVLFLVFIITGCSVKQPFYSNQKIFPEEDRDIFTALYLREEGDYLASAKLFHRLFEKTARKEYKIEEIKNLIVLREYQKAINEGKKAIKIFSKDENFYRLIALSYFHKKEYKKAEKMLLSAIECEKNPQDYILLASIYLNQKRFKLALKYYQSAYAMRKDSMIVIKMAEIMFLFLDKKKDAIAYLETHSRMVGCDENVCEKLISFYGILNNTDGMMAVYKRLYEKFQRKEYADKLVELYLYKKEYSEAIKFLEYTKINDTLLLELYKLKKMYKEAGKLALELYKINNNIEYLAQNALFEYESSKDKSIDLVKKVAKKLEKVIEKMDDSVYLNYLGYLYIDHDLNVKRGVRLVKKALKQEPNSPYYLDSLAWGYFKLGRCKEAFEIMKKVTKKLGFKDKEVKIHYQKIINCLKRGKE